MKIKTFLFAIFTLTLISLTTILTLVANTKPNTSDILLIFYTSSLFLIAGCIFLGKLFVQYMKENSMPSWQNITKSLRVSFVFSAFCTLGIYFQAIRVLNTAIMISLLVGAIFTEILLNRRFSRIK